MRLSVARYCDGSFVYKIKTSTFTILQEKRCIDLFPMRCPPPPTVTDAMIVAIRPAMHLSPEIHRIISCLHNKTVGHWGAKTCKKYLRRLGHGDITFHSITEFIRQFPACEPIKDTHKETPLHMCVL